MGFYFVLRIDLQQPHEPIYCFSFIVLTFYYAAPKKFVYYLVQTVKKVSNWLNNLSKRASSNIFF